MGLTPGRAHSRGAGPPTRAGTARRATTPGREGTCRSSYSGSSFALATDHTTCSLTERPVRERNRTGQRPSTHGMVRDVGAARTGPLPCPAGCCTRSPATVMSSGPPAPVVPLRAGGDGARRSGAGHGPLVRRRTERAGRLPERHRTAVAVLPRRRPWVASHLGWRCRRRRSDSAERGLDLRGPRRGRRQPPGRAGSGRGRVGRVCWCRRWWPGGSQPPVGAGAAGNPAALRSSTASRDRAGPHGSSPRRVTRCMIRRKSP